VVLGSCTLFSHGEGNGGSDVGTDAVRWRKREGEEQWCRRLPVIVLRGGIQSCGMGLRFRKRTMNVHMAESILGGCRRVAASREQRLSSILTVEASCWMKRYVVAVLQLYFQLVWIVCRDIAGLVCSRMELHSVSTVCQGRMCFASYQTICQDEPRRIDTLMVQCDVRHFGRRANFLQSY
jgi:hypothetical protein